MIFWPGGLGEAPGEAGAEGISVVVVVVG